VSIDEIEAFQLGELAADRGVVPAHLVGKLSDAQRAMFSKSHKQWKQRAIDVDLRFVKKGIIALRAAQEADEIDDGGTEHFQIACILHLYSLSTRRYIACMIHTYQTLVIVGSVRPRRICPQIAAWVAQVGRETIPGSVEVVDLKDWPLPMDDEPNVPAQDAYIFEHTQAWSRKVSKADAFVFVTPQYNWGYPAALKNALDHLYKEWSGKPAVIVSYGGHGGDKCAGQLRQVLTGLHMNLVATMPAFTLAREHIVANAGTIEPAQEFAEHLWSLQQAFAELTAALVQIHRDQEIPEVSH